MRTGKNLLNIPERFHFTRCYYHTIYLTAGTYTISFEDMEYTQGGYPVLVYDGNGKKIRFTTGKKHSVIIARDGKYEFNFFAKEYDWAGSAGHSVTISKLMLVRGKKPGEYEPYPQTIAEKLEIIASNEQLVFDAGTRSLAQTYQNSALDGEEEKI